MGQDTSIGQSVASLTPLVH